MDDRSELPVVVFVVGPTAVGKTAAALALAQWLDAEIISADSRYLYRGMDIGTAKPTPAERAAAPHYLIDVTDPDAPWSLAEYCRAATDLIFQVSRRGKLPLLVGGTGQYVRSLLEGWSFPPRPTSTGLRDELEAFARQHGSDALFERLQRADPEAAKALDRRNVRRVVRALEVVLATGESFSAQRTRVEPPFRAVQFGLTLARQQLYARIDGRVDMMVAQGLVEETRALHDRGYGWELPAMSAIGYRQIAAHLRGECTLDNAIAAIKRDTRRFVRRQYNWFRLTDPAIRWYDVSQLNLKSLAHDVRQAILDLPSR